MPANTPSHPHQELALASQRKTNFEIKSTRKIANHDAAETVSVVIPAINESGNLPAAIQSAVDGMADEVIVVDGGSSDGTCKIATEFGATVIQSKPGRAIQQNLGAEFASGSILLFLHADSQLGPSAIGELTSRMNADPDIVGGGFYQQIANPSWKYRWLERGNAFRARFQKLIYGDQALFVRRHVFESLGGFPEIPFLEDFEFSRQLSRLGPTVLLHGPVQVNARRWEENGVLWQTAKNWTTTVLYRLGVSADQLAAIYRRHDESRRI